MKTHKILLLSILSCVVLSSCATNAIIPKAINTINTVRLKELNLERNDYSILNTVTASATVSITKSNSTFIFYEESDGFRIRYDYKKKYKKWYITEVKGVARFGFLSNDYFDASVTNNPEEIVRNIAIYRIINECNLVGGDGIIEPVISTSVGGTNKTIILTSTVSGKIIKLKTDK